MMAYIGNQECAFYASQYFNVTDPIFVTTGPDYVMGMEKGTNKYPPLNLSLVLGSRQMARNIAIPMTIVYCIILLTGILGNILTCAVIIKTAAMHTATNYYLFNLACADLFSLVIGMPPELYSMWIQYPYPFGAFMCSFRALVSEMTTYSSILCITAFSVERYFAICHPFHAHRLSDLNRVVKIIAGVWILAAANAIPYSLLSRINYVCDFQDRPIPESAWCGVPFNMPHGKYVPLLLWSAFAFLVIPMAVLVVLYIKIGLKLKASARVQLLACESGSSQIKSKQGKRAAMKKRPLYRADSSVDAMLADSPNVKTLGFKTVVDKPPQSSGYKNGKKKLNASLLSIAEEGITRVSDDDSTISSSLSSQKQGVKRKVLKRLKSSISQLSTSKKLRITSPPKNSLSIPNTLKERARPIRIKESKTGKYNIDQEFHDHRPKIDPKINALVQKFETSTTSSSMKKVVLKTNKSDDNDTDQFTKRKINCRVPHSEQMNNNVPKKGKGLNWSRKSVIQKLSRQQKSNSTMDSIRTKSELKRTRSRTDAIKMLVAVVVTFFICWAPFNAQRLLFVFVKHWTTEKRMIMEKLYNVTGCLYYANSTVNPILYNLMSKRFRKAFFEILCPSCRPKGFKKARQINKTATQMTIT